MLLTRFIYLVIVIILFNNGPSIAPSTHSDIKKRRLLLSSRSCSAQADSVMDSHAATCPGFATLN